MYGVDTSPPVVAGPPARTGWPRPARWALGILLAVILGLVAAAVATAVAVLQQYPAKVSIPDTVLGMQRSPELTAEFLGDDKLSPDARRFISEHRMIAQAYVSDDGTRAASVLAAADFVLFPANELSTGLHQVAGVFELSGEVTDVPTGELGGSAACVNVRTANQGHGVMCGWADHGSVGLVTIVGAKDRDEAARWMLDIREAVVTR